MVPDAVLSAFVEAKGCREATKAIAGVQEQLREAKKDADLATAAVNRFGRTRGIAVLDVNAAKAKAETVAATKAINGFGNTNGTATLSANATAARREVAAAKQQIDGFDGMKATADVHVDTHDAARKIAAVNGEARKSSGPLAALRGAAGGAGGGLGVLAKALSGMPGAFGRLGAVVAFLAVTLIALIGPLIAVASALGPLVGLAAGVGAGMVAAAQGFGVLKLALGGVGDALKEQISGQTKAAAAAISSAGQQRAAARAIQAAQDGVRQAAQGVRDGSTAVTDAARQQASAVAALAPAYTAARRAMTDMRAAVADANLALRSARFAAQDARAALAALLAGPSPRILADAHRDITDALRGESDAARDLADAHAALEELMKPASALDLADAQDAVADAAREQVRAQALLQAALAETGAEMASQAISAEEWVHAAEAGIQIPGVTFAAGVDPAAAALALADAQNAVGDAARDAQRAQKALAALEAGPTQDALAAARRRVEDAERAVTDARRDTADAQRALRDLETPASSEAIARARHEVALAENAVADAQRDRTRAMVDLNAAEARGIHNAPEVVAAREAIRDATRAVAEADRGLIEANRAAVRASQALSDAQLSAKESAAGAAIAAANLNEKMAKLPASAQAFVKQLIAMKPKLDELRTTAADGFFPGATAGLQAAMGSFASVNKVVGETSKVLGEAAQKSGDLVGSAAFGKDIETIGGNNAKVLETMGEALRHVISAFRHLLIAAAPLTQWLADVANKWALNAAEAAKAGRETGKTAEFFEKTKAVAQKLGSILGSLGSALLGVGKAGSVSGNDILDSIDRAAKRFDEWANSAKGQKDLHEFFRRSQELAASLIPVLAGITKALGLLALKLLPLTTFFTLLGPAVDEVVIAFVAFKVAATIAGVIGGLTTALLAARTAYTMLAGGAALATVAQSTSAGAAVAAKVAMLAGAAATGVMTAAQWLLNAALTANPIGIVVVALVALVAGLVVAYKESETFREIVDAAFKGAAAAFDWLLTAAKNVFEWIKGNWPLLLAILTGPIGLAIIAIREFGPKIMGAAKGLLDKFVEGVKSAAAALVASGGWVVNRVIEGAKSMGEAVMGVGGWIKNRVEDGLHAVAAAFKGFGGWVINRIFEFTQGVDPIGFLKGIGGWIVNRVRTLIEGGAAAFAGFGGYIINRIFEFVESVDPIGNLKTIGSWIKNRIEDLLNAGKGGFTSLGGAIIGWIVDGLEKGGLKIQGFLNKIIGIIEDIPGVGKLPRIDVFKVEKDARGGIHAARGGAPGATQMLAHGGAFARTGGFVNSPITLMGEEAPRHPEFVIPTNPAYRGRAQMLAAQAAQAVGLATGGRYSVREMASLADRVGAPNPRLMGAIGMAESGGDPRATGIPTSGGRARGLWQIMWPLHAPSFPGMDPYQPNDNARMMKSILGSQGLGAWEAYTKGMHQQYMSDEGGGPLGAIGDVLGAAGGVLGDLLSKGAGFILDKLPGVGDLPDWLKGTGTHVLGKVGEWIKDKVSGLVGAGGGGGGGGGAMPSGLTDEIKGAIAYSRTIGNWTFGPGQGFRPGGTTYHGSGRAIDFGDAGHSAAEMRRLYGGLKGRYGSNIKELFYDPMGEHVKNGQTVGRPFGGHGDHVHLALAQGGKFGGILGSYANGTDYVPRDGAYMLHKGERVTPAAANNQPLEVVVTFDGLPVELQRLVKVEVKRNGDEVAATWRAGKR